MTGYVLRGGSPIPVMNSFIIASRHQLEHLRTLASSSSFVLCKLKLLDTAVASCVTISTYVGHGRRGEVLHTFSCSRIASFIHCPLASNASASTAVDAVAEFKSLA